jgi:hypothetical protein
MSGIFVERDDTFKIQVYYKVDEKEGVTIEEAEGEGVESLSVVFGRPDFSTSQQIVDSSTYTDGNGDPAINIIHLKQTLLYSLARSWDAKGPDGKDIELNNESISKLRVVIAKALIEKLIEEVGPVL